MDTKTTPVGVIVGRFQLAELHDAHKELIQFVLDRHKRVIIALGTTPVAGTIQNPLSYECRKDLIYEAFPEHKNKGLHILPIADTHCDKVWSANLDTLIGTLLGPRDSATLYGGRDSFINHYTGRFETVELTSDNPVSATVIREKIGSAPQNNKQFRAGAIWATYQRYPTVYPTVDVLVHNLSTGNYILGRKKYETKLRFFGGFVSPEDESYEHAAVRELFEETGIECQISDLKYIGSFKVNDWRYRNNPNEKIITHLYFVSTTHPYAANDDIYEIQEVSSSELMNVLTPEHAEILKKDATYGK